jgi:uncharacterized protein DUF5985
MNAFVTALGALVVGLCGVLLLRGYVRTHARLLLWSGLCFTGLMVSNMLLFIDLFVLREDVTLYVWRLGTAAAAMLLLLYGLINESD